MNSKAVWVWSILSASACLVAIGFLPDHRLAKRAPLFQKPPQFNDTYDRLATVAKQKFRKGGVWRVMGANEALEIAEVLPEDAFGLIKVGGMQVQLMSRVYFPVLTDRPVPLYGVYLLGTGTSKEDLRLMSPPGRKVELLDRDRRVGSWLAKPTTPIQQRLESRSDISEWRSATVIHSGRSLKRPPIFEPVPAYQVDMFENGVCTGTFAAWCGDMVSSVRWYSTGDSGQKEGKPTEKSTEVVDIKSVRFEIVE